MFYHQLLDKMPKGIQGMINLNSNNEQHTFFAITYDNSVLSLFDHYHKFTVDDLIAQHELQDEEPLPEFDPTTNLETEASQQLRFEA